MSESMSQRTAAAPVDAVLLAQALWRNDTDAVAVLNKYGNPWEVNRQLAGWLRVAVQKALEYGAGIEFDDDDEFDVIARWIVDVQAPQDQGVNHD